MAKNDYGQGSRAAQDVDVPASTQGNTDHENYHYGRGGAANITKRSEGQETPARTGSKESETTGEKAKGFLEKIGLKKT
jgi:hypothetical protein